MPERRFIEERRREIARLVGAEGRATVSELGRHLAVSDVTVRKDLSWLQSHGLLVRTRGGALAGPGGQPPGLAANRDRRSELAFEVRERLLPAQKAAIGRAAAALVHDGDSIALDASTTALQVARHLKERRELTVITNGIRIAFELAGIPGITVLMPGGQVRWEALSLVGDWGEDLLRRVNVEKAFVGSVGVTVESGLTDVTHEESGMKRALISAAGKTIAIVDHTKWGRVAFSTFCRLEQLDTLITDSAVPEMEAEARARGVRVTIAGAAGT